MLVALMLAGFSPQIAAQSIKETIFNPVYTAVTSQTIAPDARAAGMGDVGVAMETTYHDAYCGDNCAYGQIMGMPMRYELADKLIAIVQQFGSDCVAILP